MGSVVVGSGVVVVGSGVTVGTAVGFDVVVVSWVGSIVGVSVV